MLKSITSAAAPECLALHLQNAAAGSSRQRLLPFDPVVDSSDAPPRPLQLRHVDRRPNWLAGHIGLELANFRELPDWICMTTSTEVGASRAAATLRVPAARCGFAARAKIRQTIFSPKGGRLVSIDSNHGVRIRSDRRHFCTRICREESTPLLGGQLFSSSTKPDGMARKTSRSEATSRSCRCRRARLNSTAKKTSGTSTP